MTLLASNALPTERSGPEPVGNASITDAPSFDRPRFPESATKPLRRKTSCHRRRSTPDVQLCLDLPAPRYTLADVVNAVRQASSFGHIQKRDALSALAAVSDALGESLGSIAADPSVLMPRISAMGPQPGGRSRKTWSNVLSALRRALGLLYPDASRPFTIGISSNWEALRDRCHSRYTKIALSRLLAFASREGIDPAMVTLHLFRSFEELLRRSLIRNADASVSHARAAWEAARKAIPEWPQISWSVEPKRAVHFSLPWSAFPRSLWEDVEKWAAFQRGDRLLEGAMTRMRASTVADRIGRIKAFASAAIHQGIDPKRLRSLRDLVAVDVVEAGMNFLLVRNGQRPAPGVVDAAELMRFIARDWVKVPEDHCAALAELATKVRPKRKDGLTGKNRERLRFMDDPAALRALLELPALLIDEASAATAHPARSAALVQIALAIELLLAAPIRIGNLAAMDRTKNIGRSERDPTRVSIIFHESEVKNGHYLEYALPQRCIDLLNLYEIQYLPRISPENSTALFPSQAGGAKIRATLGTRISRVIREFTGLAVNPTLFRHIMARVQLDASPGAYGTVACLLGHQSTRTAKRAYTGTETASAARQYHKVIEDLRTRPGPETKGARS